MARYDFGTGTSNPDTFPSAEFGAAADRAINRLGGSITQYPGGLGFAPLRELLARRESEREGVAVDPDHIMLANGSMQAVTLVGETLRQGHDDIVMIEELTYLGTISAYKGLGYELCGVPVDDDGMDVVALGQRLRELHDAGRPPRFIYTLATYQNPTGAVMPLERRKALVAVAREFDCILVEDNCYGDVHFDGDKPPALFTLDDSVQHVYIGSLSKIFAPGVRLGYLWAESPLFERFVARRFDAGPSTLSAAIVAEYFGDSVWPHTEMANTALKAKRDALVAGLERYLGNQCRWQVPVGGLFLWLEVPEDVDHGRLAELAVERDLAFVDGRAFHIAGDKVPYIRLAFGFPALDDIEEGTRVLASCISDARTGASG